MSDRTAPHARRVRPACALLLFLAVPHASGFAPHLGSRHAAVSSVVRHLPSSSSAATRRPRPLLMSDAAAVAPTEDAAKNPPNFEKFGVGILRDYKQRLPFLASDVKDGLNLQCLAATLFLFFACLAPAIGFGALFGAATGGAIGTVEMMSSTAACGVIYALTSAQPLTIIGSTGPVLAFVACLFQVAKIVELPFLPIYAYTGLWTSLILLISSLTSASNLVKYLTRFTDDIFSLLISTIFVVEAVSDIGRTFTSPASTLTKALLTLCCAVFTYGSATVLKGLRQGVYLNKTLRNNISNFAPTIGVVGGALIARAARLSHGAMATLPTLAVPATFATTSGRPWLIPLNTIPVWARFGCIIPALMATVLLFLDQNITVRLVNSPRYKMIKGRRKGSLLDGMHADLFIVSLLTAATSVVGLPWLVAATVRSISHVRALSVLNPDGTVEKTREQRITGLTIHSFIGASIFFNGPRNLLAQVPLSVLMGLFMYLGISALPGNEMWERTKLLFTDSKLAPESPWKATVPKNITNLFTSVQIACLGAMFWVKGSPIGVLFPIIIAMLAPLRFGLEKFGIIKKEYMDILDKDEE